MRRVGQASLYPHHCAVIPFKGTSNTQFFIDTGVDLRGIDPHVYISADAAVQIAEEIGWCGPSVIKGRDARIDELEAEMDDLKAQLQDAERQLEAIDFLGSKDFVARQKRGPKKKETPIKVEA